METHLYDFHSGYKKDTVCNKEFLPKQEGVSHGVVCFFQKYLAETLLEVVL